MEESDMTRKAQKHIERQTVYAMFEHDAAKLSESVDGEFRLYFVTPATHNGAPVMRHITDSTWPDDLAQFGGYYLANLQLRAWYDKDHKCYGAHIQYRDVYSVELERAEAMATTLRRIKTKVAKLEETYGAATTFEQRAIYTLRVLGVEQLVRRADEEFKERTGNAWRYTTVTGLPGWVFDCFNPPERRAF
jgi:hypothetical protein